jgi:hypothetical protein
MWKRFLLGILVIGALVALIAYFGNREHSATSTRTFNLSEFGVAITIPSSLNDLEYSVRTQQGINTVLHMIIEDSCEIGVFYKIEKDAIPASRTNWTKDSLAAAQGSVDGNPAQVKEFTDFYLAFEPSQATCSTKESDIETETKKRADLWNSLVTARFMS